MKIFVVAKIKWLPFEQGGRQRPVEKNVKYCPIIVFDSESCNNSDWSAEIYNGVTNDANESIARISFLADNAPFELLQKDNKFKLREGSKLVATGIIQT